MSKISIIIPVLNEAQNLKRRLPELLQLEEAALEILLADGGSTDNGRLVAAQFPHTRWIDCPRKGRSYQMNHAAKLAKGDVLLFLHADTSLPRKALCHIKSSLDNPTVFAGSFCMRFDREDWFYRLCAGLSRLNFSFSTYGDQGLFLRKPDFDRLGGFKTLPFLEDVEIQSRLRKQGKFIKLPMAVVTSVRRFERNGRFRQAGLNLLLLTAYYLGFSAHTLKKWYPDKKRG
ncbi:MAG: TIGR04283 family arsenosugar biosynthesis glycosyltransferase [Bacteroidota bacterium]